MPAGGSAGTVGSTNLGLDGLWNQREALRAEFTKES